MSSGRQTYSKPIPERLVTAIHHLVLAASNIYSVSSEILLGHLEIEKLLPRPAIFALNVGAVVCQARSSRALCCLDGTRAFGNCRWILSPSLAESLGYRENCFPFRAGEVEGERRSGTICWESSAGLGHRSERGPCAASGARLGYALATNLHNSHCNLTAMLQLIMLLN